MRAWANGNYDKVALMAPLALEHLGKAVLWRCNPVLLTPLGDNAEASLMSLATAPSLGSPKLRTIGLKQVLDRVEIVIEGLAIVHGDKCVWSTSATAQPMSVRPTRHETFCSTRSRSPKPCWPTWA